MPGPQLLSAEQVLLTTLVVKLAVMAALATMLVRYRRFRHILIFERRAWPERLLFAFTLGVPLTAGVASRLLLNYDAADLTLEGAFVVGLIAGPYAGAIVGVLVGLPPLAAGEFIALFLCGGVRLRRRRPSRTVPQGSDLALLAVRLHHAAAIGVADAAGRQVDWPVILLIAPVALELIRQVLGWRWIGDHRLFFLHPEPWWSSRSSC